MGRPEQAPRFFFSLELGGGRVWESSLELPEGGAAALTQRIVA
jgi:hypothetical protein